MTTDPDALKRNIAIESAKRRIAWLRGLADAIERDEDISDIDIHELRVLANAFERGISE